MPRCEDPEETRRWESGKELSPPPSDVGWLEVEQLWRQGGMRKRRREERRQEYAELLGEIAILEWELGISGGGERNDHG